jgi:hypothetical protein
MCFRAINVLSSFLSHLTFTFASKKQHNIMGAAGEQLLLQRQQPSRRRSFVVGTAALCHISALLKHCKRSCAHLVATHAQHKQPSHRLAFAVGATVLHQRADGALQVMLADLF